MTIRELLAAAKPGDTVTIPPGRYFEQLKISGMKDLRIEAAGVVLDGGRAPKGQSGVRLQKCQDIVIEGITSQNWTQKSNVGGNGILATDSTGIKFLDVSSLACEGSGLLTGGVSKLLIRGGKFLNSDGHNIYVSRAGQDIRIEGVRCEGAARCSIQVNGRPSRITNVSIVDSDLRGAKNAAVQLAYVTDAKLSAIRGSGGRQGIVVFEDDGGKRGRCIDIDLSELAGWKFNIHPTSEGVKLPA